MKLYPIALIVMLFSLASAHPQRGASSNTEEVGDIYWCSKQMVIQPDPALKLNKKVYQNAIKFWQPAVPDIVIRLSKPGINYDSAVVVVVKRSDFFTGDCDIDEKGKQKCSIAEFTYNYGDRNPNSERSCVKDAVITLFESFFQEAPFDITADFTHEMGHVLGLDHEDGTVMTGSGKSILKLKISQIKLLRQLYPPKPH